MPGSTPPANAHTPISLAAGWGDAVLRLPAIHLVFGLAKRWLLGTHHGAVRRKHLQAYLDEYVFRFNRRTASISHRFARLIEQRHSHPTGHLPSHRRPNRRPPEGHGELVSPKLNTTTRPDGKMYWHVKLDQTKDGFIRLKLASGREALDLRQFSLRD